MTTPQAGISSSGFNSLPKPPPHSSSATLWRPFSLRKDAYLLCAPSPSIGEKDTAREVKGVMLKRECKSVMSAFLPCQTQPQSYVQLVHRSWLIENKFAGKKKKIEISEHGGSMFNIDSLISEENRKAIFL